MDPSQLDLILLALRRKTDALPLAPGSGLKQNISRALNASDPVTKLECIFIIRDYLIKIYESGKANINATQTAAQAAFFCEAALTYFTLNGAGESDALTSRIYLKEIRGVLSDERNP